MASTKVLVLLYPQLGDVFPKSRWSLPQGELVVSADEVGLFPVASLVLPIDKGCPLLDVSTS